MLFWERLTDKFCHTYNNLFLLMKSYLQGAALRRELLIAPFVKRFKATTLGKAF